MQLWAMACSFSMHEGKSTVPLYTCSVFGQRRASGSKASPQLWSMLRWHECKRVIVFTSTGMQQTESITGTWHNESSATMR
eukprot:356071-Chlamydomonas_euryale.AAC.2